MSHYEPEREKWYNENTEIYTRFAYEYYSNDYNIDITAERSVYEIDGRNIQLAQF